MLDEEGNTGVRPTLPNWTATNDKNKWQQSLLFRQF